jgi:hypothetical protein
MNGVKYPFKKKDGFKYNYNEFELRDIRNHFYPDRRIKMTQNQGTIIEYDHFNKLFRFRRVLPSDVCFNPDNPESPEYEYIHLDDLLMIIKYLSEER